MLAELDILAIEPFYGGQRKAMLETIIRCSRHRWTLLKLPPRRIERRLTAGAQWFAEHLNLHWVANVDLIFASDALNLADLYRLIPQFAGKPSVAYFHDNQLPLPGAEGDITEPAAPSVLANLSTAATAHELWFNSNCHLQTFLARTKALLEKQVKNFARNPLAELAEKSKVMSPPTDMHLARHVQTASSVQRDRRILFVDTRDADCHMLNEALATLKERGEKFQLITVGPAIGLSDEWPRATVLEGNDFAIVQGMLKSGIYISARGDLFWDDRLLTALSAGCWPIVPAYGVYPELIPKELEERCLYDGTAGHLAFTVQDFWELQLPEGHRQALESILRPVQAEDAVAAMDERMVELAIAAPSTGKARGGEVIDGEFVWGGFIVGGFIPPATSDNQCYVLLQGNRVQGNRDWSYNGRMAQSILVTLEKELPDAAAMAAYAKAKSGKAIGRESDRLDYVARRKNVAAPTALLSESRDALIQQLREQGMDPDKMRLPPEQWFSAADGLKTVRELAQYVLANLNDFKQPNPILRDLKAIEALLGAAEAAGVRFHFSKD